MCHWRASRIPPCQTPRPRLPRPPRAFPRGQHTRPGVLTPCSGRSLVQGLQVQRWPPCTLGPPRLWRDRGLTRHAEGPGSPCGPAATAGGHQPWQPDAAVVLARPAPLAASHVSQARGSACIRVHPRKPGCAPSSLFSLLSSKPLTSALQKAALYQLSLQGECVGHCWAKLYIRAFFPNLLPNPRQSHLQSGEPVPSSSSAGDSAPQQRPTEGSPSLRFSAEEVIEKQARAHEAASLLLELAIGALLAIPLPLQALALFHPLPHPPPPPFQLEALRHNDVPHRDAGLELLYRFTQVCSPYFARAFLRGCRPREN